MPSSSLPIVLIHQGNSFYLPYSLVQVTQTNPNSKVYLLGNGANAMYSNLVEHRHSKDYFKYAEAFASIYEHHSTNPHDYELFCLQRWFVLLAFMEQEGLEECLYLDSDILYFGRADDEWALVQARAGEAGLTSVTKSPHTNYIRDRRALRDFCDYITACYATPEGKTKLMGYLEMHEAIHGKLGGISDMTFFLHYRLEYPERILDLSVVAPSNTGAYAYDITIDTTEGYVATPNGLKAITFKTTGPASMLQPYASLANGESARMVTLHFQGASKQYMAEFVKAKPANYQVLLRYYKARDMIMKVMRKLKLGK